MRHNLRGNSIKASKKTPKNQLFNKCSQEDVGPATTPLTTTQGDTTTITTNMAATSPSSPLFPGFNLPSSLSGMTNDPDTLKTCISNLVIENMNLREMLTKQDTRMTQLENKILSLEQKLSTPGMTNCGKTIQTVIDSHTQQIISLNTKVEEAVKEWKNNLDNQFSDYFALQEDKTEQDKLSDTVIVNSPLFPSDMNQTNSKEITLQIIKDQTKVTVPESEIKEARLLGSHSRKSVMLRFHSHDRKKDLIMASIKVKKEVYINECLTKKRQLPV
ncbi:uncharacterized protein [Cherax quadricarinatus]|uniref:uncharacterized protein n=1 Tax=Cherax quadricarinatus TaxID=27406 RepID=UPI00387ED9FF